MAKTTKKEDATKEVKVETKKETKTKDTKNNVKTVEETKEIKIEPKILEKPKNDEMILCRSCTLGELYYKSVKTGLIAIWSDMGAEEYLEFGELITMKSSQARFLTEPWIIIDDERAVKYLGLEKLYNDMNDIESIENFFSLDLTTMQSKLRSYPSGLRKLIGEKAREMIQNETLYDLRVIELLEKELNIDLQKNE